MKLESLVIVDDNATVNDMSDFAHTAHHARKIFEALIFLDFSIQILLLRYILIYLYIF